MGAERERTSTKLSGSIRAMLISSPNTRFRYMRLRRFPEALRKLDQVLNITPDDVRTVAFKAGIAQAEGDLPRAASLLAPLHPNADDPAPWKHKFTKRSWSAALQQSSPGYRKYWRSLIPSWVISMATCAFG